MLSIPAAMQALAAPLWIVRAARIVAWSPEPQTLLTIVQLTESGKAPFLEACLAGAWPTPAETTFPTNNSWILSGSIPVRSIVLRMLTPAKAGAVNMDKSPRKRPMGVLLAPMSHTVVIVVCPLNDPLILDNRPYCDFSKPNNKFNLL
jgi:hypothetical protein